MKIVSMIDPNKSATIIPTIKPTNSQSLLRPRFASSAETVARRGHARVRVGSDLESLLRDAHIRPGGDAAESLHEEHGPPQVDVEDPQ